MKFLGKIFGFSAELDNGNSGAAKTIVVAAAQKQKLTLNSSCTITIDATGLAVGNYQLRLVQDATGGRVVTWSGLSASRWIGSAAAPSVNLAVSGETIVSLYYDGTNFTQSLGRVGVT